MLQQSTEEEVSKQSQRQNLWVIVVIESHIYYIKELACVCFLPAKFPVPLCRLAFRWNVPELGTKLVFLCSQFAAETTITKSILIFVLPELQFQFDFDPFFCEIFVVSEAFQQIQDLTFTKVLKLLEKLIRTIFKFIFKGNFQYILSAFFLWLSFIL